MTSLPTDWPAPLELLDLWNSSLPLPQDLAGLESRPFVPEDSLVIRDPRGRLVGFASLAGPERPWAPGTRGPGNLRVLIVHPDARGRGHGTRLISWAEDELRSRGATSLNLGGELRHYFPGVPDTQPDTIAWLQGRGYELGGLSNDLARDLTPGSLPPLELPAGVTVAPDGPAAVEFVAQAFPGRWTHEVAWTVERSPEQALVMRVNGVPSGFALHGLRSDPVMLPNALWPTEDCGLGPMGMSPELRGRGLGKQLLIAAMVRNAARGGRRMGIDWTGVQGFYMTVGFQIVRRYRHLSRPL
ncbi:MAG TPA: GNAT family N-acetyltransferase [Deinococcales bacterium]|nr:GNAT family N-acetyltransferase [Deinococcales bacterium]